MATILSVSMRFYFIIVFVTSIATIVLASTSHTFPSLVIYIAKCSFSHSNAIVPLGDRSLSVGDQVRIGSYEPKVRGSNLGPYTPGPRFDPTPIPTKYRKTAAIKKQ